MHAYDKDEWEEKGRQERKKEGDIMGKELEVREWGKHLAVREWIFSNGCITCK